MTIKTIAILIIVAMTWMKNFNDIHKFQQYGYYMNQYLKYVFSSNNKLIKPYESLYIIGVVCVFFVINLPINVLGILLLLLTTYFYRLIVLAYPAKKKCVYTPRVKRMLTTSGILLAIVGVIAWFIPSLYGGILFIIIYPMSFVFIYLGNLINKPIENAINNYYYNDAKRIMTQNPNLIVIGITGSYGKTSTKNILYSMLSKDFNVLMTPESFNTKMGLTRTIREHLKPTHQIFIAEMGAKEVGDIKELCDFVNPSIGLITSIGPQHLDTFKTLKNIIATKGELFKYLTANGRAFINTDDSNIMKLPSRADLNTIQFSVEKDIATENLDYTIESISIGANGSSFTLIHVPTGKKMRLNTRLLGRHNLTNVVAGAAIALSLGVPMERLCAMTADLKPVEHRLSYRRVNNQYTVLDDAFNSNPIGSKMALEVLSKFDGNKKIIITPGMVELGDQAYALNKAFGESIADYCDYVILVGKKQTLPIQDGLSEKKYPSYQMYIAADLRDAFRKLSEIVALDDIVLIENDLPDTFNE